MLYFKFKNYEEFKEDFGMRNSTRKNGILLSFLKNEMKQRHAVPKIHNLNDMYHYILNKISAFSDGDLCLMDKYQFVSDVYMTDKQNGICKDGDSRSIRYIRKEDNREFKMKAGKFLRKLLMENEQTNDMAEQAIIYVCETFSSEWTAYVESKQDCNYILVVDDDFESIYDSESQQGGFNSCMNDKGYESFYRDCVDAKAASLWDDNVMVARCVIFTKVRDVRDKNAIYRLAERQYSACEDNKLKQILVNRLIEGGFIDGYKKVGASCHDPRMFLLNNGESLSEKHLYIPSCNVEDYDVPYMDSFKYYNYDSGRFYNVDSYRFTHIAENTDGSMDACGEWDEYHQCYCGEVRDVYAWDYTIERHVIRTCDVDCLDNFHWCEREYDYYERTDYSAYEGCYIPYESSVFSDYLDDYLHNSNARWCDEMNDWLPKYDYDDILTKWILKHEEELCEVV